MSPRKMVTASAPVSNRAAALFPESWTHISDKAHFLIPRDHSTSANSLLTCAKIRNLLGEYPNDYFFNWKSLPLPPALDISRAGADDWPALPDATILETPREPVLRTRPSYLPALPLANPF